MKDFCGNELAVGDIVAVAPKGYRGLVKAKVIAFTPKQVRVEYPSRNVARTVVYLLYPEGCVKI